MNNAAVANTLASEVVHLPQKAIDSTEEERGYCWSFNVADQFPIQSVKEENNTCVVTVGSPHSNYSIKTTMVNGRMSGESIMLSSNNIRVATLVFENGIANGPCVLYDRSGLLFYKGRFEDGFRQGKGKEYDCNENLVFEGFYEKGKRLSIYPLNEMKGYWKEVDEQDNVVNIGKRDENGRLEGICYFYSNGRISHVSEWKDGKENLFTGAFKLYDEPNHLWFEGRFEDGLRQGKGKEYDCDGNIVFEGFYEKGKRLKISPMSEMKGYWKEVDEDNNLVRVTKNNDNGRLEGICYFYSNGRISRISEWKDGKEISLLKTFNGNLMTEYTDGVNRFHGEFINDITLDYPRNGKGEEYDNDGKTLLFKGTYLCGKRHGKGIVYKNNAIKTKRDYILGHTKMGLICTILGVLLLVICCYVVNILAGISLLSIMCLLLLTRWKCSKILGNKIRSAIDLEFLANVVKNKCQDEQINYENKLKTCCKAFCRTVFGSIYLSLIIVLLIINIFTSMLYIFVGPRDVKYKQTEYVVQPNRFNYLIKFKISNRPYLKSIDIGSNSCSAVNEFTLKGLKALGTLMIGNNSFTRNKYEYYDGKSKSFHILNCDKLKLIEIGQYSFSDYAGEFELKNLPSLKSIRIGIAGKDSINFYYSDMIIESNNDNNIIVMYYRSSEIRIDRIG